MSSHTSFTTLITLLGQEGAQSLLKLAQPELQQTQQALLDSLQQHDWQAAAALAHKLVATAYLYDCSDLQTLVEEIRRQNLTTLQHPTFIPKLMRVFQQIHDNIRRFTHPDN